MPSLDARLLERSRELMGESVDKIDAAMQVKPKSKKFQVNSKEFQRGSYSPRLKFLPEHHTHLLHHH